MTRALRPAVSSICVPPSNRSPTGCSPNCPTGRRTERWTCWSTTPTLSITVICRLVGIPAADLERWREWGGDLVSMRPERLQHSFPVMIDYCHQLIEQRRVALRDDLLSELIRAQDDDGGRLSDTEMVTMVLTLVLAGHETSTHLIGNGTAALLSHPDQLARLRENPALFPRAVHELMRWCGSVQVARLRYAVEDLEIAGTRIAQR